MVNYYCNQCYFQFRLIYDKKKVWLPAVSTYKLVHTIWIFAHTLYSFKWRKLKAVDSTLSDGLQFAVITGNNTLVSYRITRDPLKADPGDSYNLTEALSGAGNSCLTWNHNEVSKMELLICICLSLSKVWWLLNLGTICIQTCLVTLDS